MIPHERLADLVRAVSGSQKEKVVWQMGVFARARDNGVIMRILVPGVPRSTAQGPATLVMPFTDPQGARP